jgi:hypothetical protein
VVSEVSPGDLIHPLEGTALGPEVNARVLPYALPESRVSKTAIKYVAATQGCGARLQPLVILMVVLLALAI